MPTGEHACSGPARRRDADAGPAATAAGLAATADRAWQDRGGERWSGAGHDGGRKFGAEGVRDLRLLVQMTVLATPTELERLAAGTRRPRRVAGAPVPGRRSAVEDAEDLVADALPVLASRSAPARPADGGAATTCGARCGATRSTSCDTATAATCGRRARVRPDRRRRRARSTRGWRPSSELEAAQAAGPAARRPSSAR